MKMLAAAPVVLAALFACAAPALAASPATLYQAPFVTTAPLATETPQQLAERVAALTDFPTILDPRIWTPEHRMRPEVSSRLIAIINRQFSGLKLRNKALAVSDIELFGSNASYEYDDKADLGIHVFLSTASNPEAYREDVLDLEHFMRLLNDAIELKQEGEISFHGIPLEIVFHATRPPGYRDADKLPQYSVWSTDATRTGRWINPKTPPPPVPKSAFDPKVIATRTAEFMVQYNVLAAAYFSDKQSFDCDRFVGFQKSMKTYRHEGISKDGQRSNGNLTYRLLRRLTVNIPDTVQVLDRECRNIKDSLF